MEKEEITRRDFLKFAGLSGLGLLIPGNVESYIKSRETWPKLNEDLPSLYNDILLRAPQTDFSELGILRMETTEYGVDIMSDVPVCQTNFNKKFLKIAKKNPSWRFVTDQPLGLAWHWYGDRPEYTATWYPGGTAKEYVAGGLNGDCSVQFVVGDGIPEPGQEALDQKLAIVQSELPDENGNWVSSAHILNVDRSLYRKGTQYFANTYYLLMEKYGFSNPDKATILQRLYQPGFNDRPNIQLIGMEIQGSSFDDPEFFPSQQKLANILAVSLAVIKRNKISSPAFNAYGHQELDFNKADPGKNVIMGMKMLIGISALTSDDQELKNLVFGPFSHGGAVSKEQAVADYFSFVTDYFSMSAGPQSYVDYWLNYFQTDAVQDLVSRKFTKKNSNRFGLK